MKKMKTILMAVIVVAVAIGAFTLISWEIPAPSEKIERVLPDDNFPR